MEEPQIGATCAQRLGRPETIRDLAQALKSTGNGLDELVVELRRQVSGLVPATPSSSGVLDGIRVDRVGVEDREEPGGPRAGGSL
jgi:hypothetical protein